MEKVELFLKNLIENFSEQQKITHDEQDSLKKIGLYPFIVNKIKTRKYSGSPFPQELQDKIATVVSTAMKENKPIHFSIPFGGFKNWRAPGAPLINWSEIFNVIQIRNFATEIAKVYEPGVIIQWVSDEIFVTRINNIPQADLDKYNSLFNLAVAYVQQYTPSNVMLRYTKIRDEISYSEVWRRLDEGIIQQKKDWEKLSKEVQDMKIAKAKRNLVVDESKYSEKELFDLYFNSTIGHDAFINTDWEQGVPWAFRADMIPIGFRYTNKWGIHMKSSRGSTAQFWVGIGVIEKRDQEYLPLIISYNQFKEIETKLEYVKVPCKVLPSCFGLKEIPVFTKKATK